MFSPDINNYNAHPTPFPDPQQYVYYNPQPPPNINTQINNINATTTEPKNELDATAESERKAVAQRRKALINRVWTAATVIAIVFATGFALSIWSTVDSIAQGKSTRQGQCAEIDGNEDMYGLGIRLAIYIQLIVTSIVDIFGHGQHTSLSLAPASLWFLLALFVALMRMSHNPSTYAIEPYILISLGNGITWVLLGGGIKLDPHKLREPAITSFSRFVIWGLWRGASSMYWWTLNNKQYPDVEDDCGPWGWLIVRVKLHSSSFQILHKICNIVSWTALAQTLVPYLIGAAFFVYIVVQMDLSDLRRDLSPDISKLGILCDYMFVAVGDLRVLLFGFPARSKYENDDDDPKPEPPWRVVPQDDSFLGFGQVWRARGVSVKVQDETTQRLLGHIRQYYTSFLAPTSIVTSQNAPQASNTGTPVNMSTPALPISPHSPTASFSNIQAPYNSQPFPGGHRLSVSHTGISPVLSHQSSFNSMATVHDPLNQSQTSPLLSQQTTSTSGPNAPTSPHDERTPLSWLYGIIDTVVKFMKRYQLHHFPYLAFWDTCSVVLTVLTVEFSLKLNNVKEVNGIGSGGQLVAFIVGVGGAFIAAGNFYVEQRTVIIKKRAETGHGGSQSFRDMASRHSHTASQSTGPGADRPGAIADNNLAYSTSTSTANYYNAFGTFFASQGQAGPLLSFTPSYMYMPSSRPLRNPYQFQERNWEGMPGHEDYSYH